MNRRTITEEFTWDTCELGLCMCFRLRSTFPLSYTLDEAIREYCDRGRKFLQSYEIRPGSEYPGSGCGTVIYGVEETEDEDDRYDRERFWSRGPRQG